MLLSVALLAAALNCGSERSDVKHASDDAAQYVKVTDYNAPIRYLGALTAPQIGRDTQRTGPYEEIVYSVSATLVLFKLEADNDYHLVLSDDSGNTMIAEIPDPRCVPLSSPFYQQIADARVAFEHHFWIGTYTNGHAVKSARPESAVTVMGIGFFDVAHPVEQTGKAPNNFELHPVLSIEFGKEKH